MRYNYLKLKKNKMNLLSKMLEYKFSYNIKKFCFVAIKVGTNSVLTVESKNLLWLLKNL